MYAPLHPQHRPLHRSPFPGSIREAHAMDWHRRYKGPLCGDGQREETVSGAYCPTHPKGCGGEADPCKRARTELP